MASVRTLCSTMVLAVLVIQISALPSSARVKRQGFDWEDDGAPNNNPQSSSAAPGAGGTTTTTPSPAYSACIRRCPVLPQYNPVCGSNRVTYENESRLRCANSCGLSVTKMFGGSCSPL